MPFMSDDAASPSSVSQLLRAVGGWSGPSGRGLYMFRAITISTAFAALGGITTAVTSSILLGPVGALGFAIGSCAGFVLSTIYYWRVALQHAVAAFDAYPQLMLMHMMRNYRLMGFERVKLESREDVQVFRGRIERELRLKCMLMTAWQTAEGVITEIEASKEAKLVAKLSEEDP